MPLVRFLGFPTGASVSMAAGQDGETDDVTVAPWNVARVDEDLSIAVTRGPAPFRRAPEAVWFEAMPENFTGLTEVSGRVMQTRPAPDPAAWGAPDFVGAQGDDDLDPLDFNVEGDSTIRFSDVAAGAAPSGVLLELGGEGRGFAAAFDGSGNLVVAAGNGTATETGGHAIFLTLDAARFAGRTVDIYVCLRMWPARMMALVVENGTVTEVAVADEPNGYFNASSDPEATGNPVEEGWAGGDPGAIGQVATSGGSVRAGVVTTPFTGTLGAVECWHRRTLDHFYEDGLAVELWGDASEQADAPRPAPDTAAWGSPDRTWSQGDTDFTFDNITAPRADRAVTFRFAAISAGATPTGLVAESGGAGQGFAVAFDGAGDLVVGVGEGEQTATGNGAVFLTLSAALFADRTVDLYVSIRNDPARVAVLVVEDGVSVAFAAQDEPSGVFASDGVTVGNWTGGGDGAVGGENPLNGARSGVVTTDFTGSMGTVSAWEGVLLDDFDRDTLTVTTQVARPVHYEPEFHEIFYEWDFGDAGATFTAPRNVPAAFKDANRAIGKMACHVFEQPGTYTVTCTARQVRSLEPLTFVEVSATAQVAVGERLDVADDGPAGLFDATNTIVMSADGDFGGAPAGQQVVYGDDTAYAAALDAARQDQWSRDRALRILLKRGETGISGTWFDGAQVFVADFSTGDKRFDHVFVGTWGTGDPPETDGIHSLGPTDAREDLPESLVWEGIHIRGSYNAVTRDFDGDDAGKSLFAFTFGPGQYRLHHKCAVFDKKDIAFSLGGRGLDPRAPALGVISDCIAEGIATYGVFGGTGLERSQSKTAILGFRPVHATDGPKHDDTTTPENPLGIRNHGPHRVVSSADFVVDCWDAFVRLGWSGGGAWADGTPKVAPQPGFRVMSTTGDGPNRNARVQITRTVVEGSEFASILNLDRVDMPPYQGNVLIDSCWHLVTAATLGTSIKSEAGAVTVRNFLTTYDRASGFEPFQWARRYYASPRAGVSEADITREPVADYNNTLVVAGDNGAVDDVILDADWQTYTVSNNVLYAPDIEGQAGHVDLAPFDPAEAFAARYPGRWEMTDPAMQTQFAAPAGSASLRRPLSGSAVEGAATGGFAAPFDLLGAPRWPLASLGAIQVE